MRPKLRATYRKELIMAVTGMTDKEIKSVVVHHGKTYGELDDCIWIINHYFPKPDISGIVTKNTQQENYS